MKSLDVPLEAKAAALGSMLLPRITPTSQRAGFRAVLHSSTSRRAYVGTLDFRTAPVNIRIARAA